MLSTTTNLRQSIRKNGVSYLHIAKAASLLGSSAQYVRSACDAGELPGRLVGGAWYIPEEALVLYLRQRIKRSEGKRTQARTESFQKQLSIREKARHAVPIVGREIRIV